MLLLLFNKSCRVDKLCAILQCECCAALEFLLSTVSLVFLMSVVAILCCLFQRYFLMSVPSKICSAVCSSDIQALLSMYSSDHILCCPSIPALFSAAVCSIRLSCLFRPITILSAVYYVLCNLFQRHSLLSILFSAICSSVILFCLFYFLLSRLPPLVCSAVDSGAILCYHGRLPSRLMF